MKIKNLLLLGLTITLAVACGSGNASIEKTWALESIDYSEALKDVPQESHEQMKTMMDQMIADQKGKTTFDIQKGGKVVTNSPDYEGKWKEIKGTWTLSSDKKTLTVDQEGNKSNFTVVELTNDKLDIEMKEAKMHMIFTPKK